MRHNFENLKIERSTENGTEIVYGCSRLNVLGILNKKDVSRIQAMEMK